MYRPDIAERPRRLLRHDFSRRSDQYCLPGVARVEMARRHIAERRIRDRIFSDGTLFGEPQWEILLDLFVAYAEGRQISVTSACLASGVPVTTALRHLAALEKAGLIARTTNSEDGRSSYVWLSENGYDQIIAYFDRIAAARPSGPKQLTLISS